MFRYLRRSAVNNIAQKPWLQQRAERHVRVRPNQSDGNYPQTWCLGQVCRDADILRTLLQNVKNTIGSCLSVPKSKSWLPMTKCISVGQTRNSIELSRR